jgi:hypothetical protein
MGVIRFGGHLSCERYHVQTDADTPKRRAGGQFTDQFKATGC